MPTKSIQNVDVDNRTTSVYLAVVRGHAVVFHAFVGSNLLADQIRLYADSEDMPIDALDINQVVNSKAQAIYTTSDPVIATGFLLGSSDLEYTELKFIYDSFNKKSTIITSDELMFNFIIQY